ncbi:MAG TPA: hypothetical protein VF896_08730 [Anaerolineales bacterium]
MKLRKPNGITVMVLMPMLIFGITLADMKFRMGSPTPIRLKRIMRNFAIIWLVWLASHAASLAVRRHFVVLYASLPSASIAGNFTNSVFLGIPLPSSTS